MKGQVVEQYFEVTFRVSLAHVGSKQNRKNVMSLQGAMLMQDIVFQCLWECIKQGAAIDVGVDIVEINDDCTTGDIDTTQIAMQSGTARYTLEVYKVEALWNCSSEDGVGRMDCRWLGLTS